MFVARFVVRVLWCCCFFIIPLPCDSFVCVDNHIVSRFSFVCTKNAKHIEYTVDRKHFLSFFGRFVILLLRPWTLYTLFSTVNTVAKQIILQTKQFKLHIIFDLSSVLFTLHSPCSLLRFHNYTIASAF